MKTLLKDMKLCSVDLVPRGANPDAYICLYKSADMTINGIIHYEEISIHSPRVGETEFITETIIPAIISIHSPRVG